MLTKDSQDWVARARALAPMIEAAAGRTEKERKIPADVLSAMHACGLFHMLLPVSLGGAAVDLVTFNQALAVLPSPCGTIGFSKNPMKAPEISAYLVAMSGHRVHRSGHGIPSTMRTYCGHKEPWHST